MSHIGGAMKAVALFALLIVSVSAHSFLAFPEPFSLVETCRIGGSPGFEAHCPGPCPNYDFRDDKTPDMPSRVWKRGERVEVRWTKNNHLDGFMRLALVPIDEMWSKDSHQRYAFYFGCWTDQEFSCNLYEKHRDCYYDRENLSYKTQFTVPTIYPDGVYVLGFTWYGGGRVFGSFGDYWDCAYVEVRGGRMEETFPAAFESWDGSCMSSTDHIGQCPTEPCRPDNWSRRRIPAEFNEGAPTLYKSWYDNAMSRSRNQIAVARHRDFGIDGINVVDTNHNNLRNDNQNDVIWLGWGEKITLTPKLRGHVDKVEWYLNGKHHFTTWTYPFTISDQQPSGNWYNFYEWGFDYIDTRVYVTCVVYNGHRRAYYSHDFAFLRSG